MWIEIALHASQKLLLGCIYRSPRSTYENNMKLLNAMQKACSKSGSYLLILGDFNYPDIDWANWNAHSGSSRDFLENARDCFLQQHVLTPTRFRQNQEPHVLDLVFTKEDLQVQNCEVTSPLGKSDHAVILFDYIVDDGYDVQAQTEKYNFNKGITVNQDRSKVTQYNTGLLVDTL